MSEVRPEIVMWQSYWEIKITLEDAQDEIKKLRAALQRIVENEDQFSMAWAAEIARAALGEKE